MSLKKLPCPTCETLAIFDKSNAFRPFCSERCKLIDLGEWASEGYKVKGPSTENDFKTNQDHND